MARTTAKPEEMAHLDGKTYQSREEIEADGFTPGWSGQPVEPGDEAVIHGRGQWRRIIIERVTPTRVEGHFTTPSALAHGRRVAEQAAARTDADIAYEARVYGPSGVKMLESWREIALREGPAKWTVITLGVGYRDGRTTALYIRRRAGQDGAR